MEIADKIEKLKEYIGSADKICVFTGAGISVPSGIPDFRSANGLYSTRYKRNLMPEDIISHSFFMEDPEMFFDFYKNKMLYPQAKPNSAHLLFSELEKSGKDVSIVTQNIDGLQQMAGSSKVYELHGSVHRNYCMKCKAFYDFNFVYESESFPQCTVCGGKVKPDVVLYEEPLDSDVINNAINAIASSDLMIIIGTSLAVYPAASFVRYFNGDKLVLINKSQTPYDKNADLVIYEDIALIADRIRKFNN